MKSQILIAVLALALVIVCAEAFTMKEKLQEPVSTDSISNLEESVYNTIMTRSSIRSYDSMEVENEKIDKLLHAGMAAPSAMDKRPWHFVVVTNKETLGKIAEATPNAGMAAIAPLAIIVCGDLSKEVDGWQCDFWIQDVSAATENILLEAHALGLGAVWTGTWPSKERVAAISEIINAPEHIIPFATVVIGYPKGDTSPKDKWKESDVSYEVYDN